MNLTSPRVISEIMARHGLCFNKRFGQNFLIDDNILTKIMEVSGVGAGFCVLEIGPGLGTLTKKLAEKCEKVVAVEIDKKLIPVLGETLADYKNVSVVGGDFLKINLKELAAREFGARKFALVSNLPYSITTPAVMKIFAEKELVKSMTLMIQKEVAERAVASPGTKDYGAFSVACQYFSRPKIEFFVRPSSFMPPPKVMSCVISMEILESPAVSVMREDFFFRVVRASFMHRRKTLANALAHELKIPKENVSAAIKILGLTQAARGETLSLEKFARLSDVLLGVFDN